MNLSEQLPNDAKKAKVILVKTRGDTVRYFSKFGRKRIINAWSIAGARLFLLDSPELSLVEAELKRRGYTFDTLLVELLGVK